MISTTSTILFLHAQTSLHPGSGTASGAIDLPVQRERHTGWPLIPGSTIKGVLRDYCRYRVTDAKEQKDLSWADRDPKLECVFGPSVKGPDESGSRGSNAADFAGALAVTDARILLFPVRSLCGLFAWVTCPAALDRLSRDVRLTGGVIEGLISSGISLKNERDAMVVSEELSVKAQHGGDSNMVLEEFDFAAVSGEHNGLKETADKLSAILGIDRLKTHLALIHDDMFTHYVKNATEVNARIALDYETKTASGGALFYVETLPPETVFYSVLIADRPKGKGGEDRNAAPHTLNNKREVLAYITEKLKDNNDKPAILQIGGEASTGKGICRAICMEVKNDN